MPLLKRNRRRRTRILVSASVSVIPDDDTEGGTEETLKARLEDMTLEGCCLSVAGDPALAPGTRLLLHMPPLQQDLPLKLPGRICWVQARESSTVLGMEFDRLRRADRHALDRLLLNPGRHISVGESRRYARSRRRHAFRQAVILVLSILVALLLVFLFARLPGWLSEKAEAIGENRNARRIAREVARELARDYKQRHERGELTPEEIEELKRLREEYGHLLEEE